MSLTEIARVRELLASKPRPADLAGRRERLDSMGRRYPLPADVAVEPVDADGVPAEWTATPGADPRRVILFLHGGGYVSGSLKSHRHMVAQAGREARAHARARVSPRAGASFSGGVRGCPGRLPVPARARHRTAPHRAIRRERRRRPRHRLRAAAARGRPAAARVPMARLALYRSHDVGRQHGHEGCRGPVDPARLSRRPRRRLFERARRARAAGLAPLRRLRRPAADADPGRRGRDPARRFRAPCRRGRGGRRRGDARDLAGHDPCLAFFFPQLGEGRRSLANLGRFVREIWDDPAAPPAS